MTLNICDDAVVGVTDQPADRGSAVLPEGELAGRRRLQPHLVFQAGDEDAVTLSGFSGFRVGQVFRNQEQAEPLGSRARTLGSREHQVQDVLEQIVGVAVGDEPLDAVDVPGAVAGLDGLRASRADIGSGVGFGEHHGGGPVSLDAQLRPVSLLFVPDVVQDVRHDRAGHIEEDRRVGTQWQFVDRPRDHRRRRHAADPFVEPDPEPLALPPGVE